MLDVRIVQVNCLTLVRSESQAIAVCFQQAHGLLTRQIRPNSEVVHGHSFLPEWHEVICLDDIRVIDSFLILLLDIPKQGLDLFNSLLHVGDIC